MSSPRVADGLEGFGVTEDFFGGVLNHFIASTPMSVFDFGTFRIRDTRRNYHNLLSGTEDEIELSCDDLPESACVFM